MVNRYFLSCKWIYFLIQIHSREDWLFTTNEGGLYLKTKLLNLGILGIKLGQYLCMDKKISSNVYKILEPLLSDNIIHSCDDTIKMLAYDNNYYNINIDKIEEEVIGSGSLAQVHMCILKNKPNEKYVIKVAHPCIVELENEIKTLQSILNKVGYFKNVSIDWNNFFENIRIQIDFNNEANSMKSFYNIYKDYEKIEIPKLIYCHKYFIIMSYCEGKQINTIDKDSNEYKMATNLLASSFLHSSYKYNIYHGDLHQGNILVKPNGNIALVDFGICGKLITDAIYNEILYVYQKIYYIKDYNSIEMLLQNLILEKNEKIDYNNLVVDFILKYESNNEKIDKFFIKYCNLNNLVVNSNSVNLILQLMLLEKYDFFNKENGNIFLRTLSYMKTDNFFMNEMSEYILKFYELEYDNENDEEVLLLYP